MAIHTTRRRFEGQAVSAVGTVKQSWRTFCCVGPCHLNNQAVSAVRTCEARHPNGAQWRGQDHFHGLFSRIVCVSCARAEH